MKRVFGEYTLILLALTALLFVTDANAFFVWMGAWTLTLLCFGIWVILDPPAPIVVTPEERQLADVAETTREWRFQPSEEEFDCSGCGHRIMGGWKEAGWDDPAHGWFTESDARFCGSCAALREQAENLGTDGIRDQYAAGKLTTERRDAMVDYLVAREAAS